ncbi:MAG: RluA family pseudouridine synthase [Dehalococcoidia bacterium]|nr:RluA family pseudouridine synthase [Dehalococcoidia bacterium]
MIEEINLSVSSPSPRLDRYLAEHLAERSRSYIHHLIEEGHVRLNNKIAKPSQRLSPGDEIVVEIPAARPTTAEPEDIPYAEVFEDADLVIVDKPPGLVVHPAAGHEHGTLVNALLGRHPDLTGIAGTVRPGIVHRLDKDTSGLMVVAKNDRAHHSLSRQIKDRQVLKRYITLVTGLVSPDEGTIDAPIGRDLRNRKRMAISPSGRPARTHYRVLKSYDGDFTLVEATLETGRTHQIRVHFAAIGHPVVGDAVYGQKSPLVPRQFLHATTLGFRLPNIGEWAEFTSPLPPDLRQVLEALDRQYGPRC